MLKYNIKIKNSCGCVREVFSGEAANIGNADIKLPTLPTGGSISLEWEVSNGNDSDDKLGTHQT